LSDYDLGVRTEVPTQGQRKALNGAPKPRSLRSLWNYFQGDSHLLTFARCPGGWPGLALFQTCVGQPEIMRVAQVSGSNPSLLPCSPSSTNCVLPGLENRETRGHSAGSKAGRTSSPQRLNSLLKNSEQQIPRGLKPARNDKNKRLIGTTKVGPCYKTV
jgi:hypothetical protein